MKVLLLIVWLGIVLFGFGQPALVSAGLEFPLAGLGNASFFRPVTAFVNPALLGNELSNTVLEISVDQFADLAVSRRVEAHTVSPLKNQAGWGSRLSSIGKDEFRLYQFGLAYGRAVFGKQSNRVASIGGLIQVNRRQSTGRRPITDGVAGVSLLYSFNRLLLGSEILYGSQKNWLLSIHARQQWSDQLATDIGGFFSDGHLMGHFSIQYSFHPRTYCRFQLQANPGRIAWEQGYQLARCWITVHCIRYPLLGWKTGLGLVLNGITK